MPLDCKLLATICATEGMLTDLLPHAVIEKLDSVGKHTPTSGAANHSLLTVASHVFLDLGHSRVHLRTSSPPTLQLQSSQLLRMVLHMPVEVLRHLPDFIPKLTALPLTQKWL